MTPTAGGSSKMLNSRVRGDDERKYVPLGLSTYPDAHACMLAKTRDGRTQVAQVKSSVRCTCSSCGVTQAFPQDDRRSARKVVKRPRLAAASRRPTGTVMLTRDVSRNPTREQAHETSYKVARRILARPCSQFAGVDAGFRGRHRNTDDSNGGRQVPSVGEA